MFIKWSIGIALLAGVSASCASSTVGTTSTPRMASASLIHEQELVEVSHLNAFNAIRRLRPNWLRARGLGTFNRQQVAGIKVYIDGSFRGSLRALESIRASDIHEIQHLDPRQATTRFGTDHGDGAILVTTKG